MEQATEAKRPRRTNRERAGGKVDKVVNIKVDFERKPGGLGCKINGLIKRALERVSE
jgi:hypothetical protein